jgi:hypothetical protein
MAVLRAARLSPPWITGVTDNNGIILARSERHDDFVGKPLPTPLLEQSRTASGVFTSTSAAGIPIARAIVRSQVAGWLVSATVPVSYVEAPSLRIQGFALCGDGNEPAAYPARCFNSHASKNGSVPQCLQGSIMVPRAMLYRPGPSIACTTLIVPWAQNEASEGCGQVDRMASPRKVIHLH